MLEGMWQNWDANTLLVELWIGPTILEGNLESCTKGFKRMSALWPSHTTFVFVPQKDNNEKDLYKNIYSLTLSGDKIKIENEGVYINWGMSE